MNQEVISDKKYLFVCGLPRSGTSVLGRNVGRLEDCTEFKNTGVLEDEGQYLQDVYPVASKLGGAGDFGFHPEAHRTESSPLLTPEGIARLRECWHAHWDDHKSICVEKTPGNLLMTRFLQAAFPNSYFVVVKRHPLPVAMAVQKWKVDVVSLDRAIEHWVHCYNLFDQDKHHLERLFEFRYEDYVEDAERFHRDIAEFVGTTLSDAAPGDDAVRTVTQWRKPEGLKVSEAGMEATSSIHNKKYFDQWTQLIERSPFRAYYRHLAAKHEGAVSAHGYSLREGLSAGAAAALESAPTAPHVGELYCRGAELCAWGSRFWSRSRLRTKRAARAVRDGNLARSGGDAGDGPELAAQSGAVRQPGPFSG